MKRFYLICLICLIAHTKAIAQENYRPLVEEGKRWTYDNYLSIRPDKYNHFYWYELKGDTTINEQKCLKLYSENKYNDGLIRYEGALYEADMKVYCFFAGKEQETLLYDFGCHVGDQLNTSEGILTVKDIYRSENGNRSLRFIKLSLSDTQESNEELSLYWIEGVGCIKDFFAMAPFPGNYCSLTACEVNGEVLYQYVQPKFTEEGYHEMGIEGKTWNYIHHFVDADGIHEEPFSYVVKGDTILGRTVWKKVYYQDSTTERLAFMLLESGREVLMRNPGSTVAQSPYQFDRDDIGRVFDWNSEYGRGRVYWMLNAIDTIAVNGLDFRRFTFLQKTIEGGTQGMINHIEDSEDVWHEIWIEGVGSQYTGIGNPIHEEPPMSNDFTRFVSCYEYGQCIFTAEDFTTTSIRDIPSDPIVNRKSVNGQWHDLSGRRLTTPPTKGIYIRDGKKVVVR